jgi:hypothetical protein
MALTLSPFWVVVRVFPVNVRKVFFFRCADRELKELNRQRLPMAIQQMQWSPKLKGAQSDGGVSNYWSDSGSAAP